MRKATKLYILLGVLVAVIAAVLIVSKIKEKKEDIKKSGEVILEIPPDSVESLSWTNEKGTFSFTKKDVWTYDEDAAFPADEEKINKLLSVFESFAAAFTIENVQDYAQYGLEEPVCTVTVNAGGTTHTVKLGAFSKMDSQRYVSLGDGKAYLAVKDPMDEFGSELKDMILDDKIQEFDTAEKIVFSGTENYTIVLDENRKSICADDMYYTEEKALDTTRVKSYAGTVRSASLTKYVSYNVTDEELKTFGLDNPDLTISMDCITGGDEENPGEKSSFKLQVSRNPEEAAAYEEAVQNEEADLPQVSCYARLNESQIVYSISESLYKQLTAVSYDTLRHQTLFTADFDTALSVDVKLDGESYTFTYQKPEGSEDKTDSTEDAEDTEESGKWLYGEEEIDFGSIRSALGDLTADSFTDEQPSEAEEISLTVHLDNPDFPEYTLTLYRYDGAECLAAVDGEPVALVSRKQAVDLTEAVRAVTLGSEKGK